MDTVKIEPVVVGSEVSSPSVEIKPDPVVVPLQSSKLLYIFSCFSYIIYGNLSATVEIGRQIFSCFCEVTKHAARLLPLCAGQDESLQCFQCLITFSNSKVKERHIKKFHGDQYKQHLQQVT